MAQKYVRIENYTGGCDVVFTFSKLVGHDEFVNRMMGVEKEDVVSAGFVDIRESDLGNPIYHCYGKSVSLGLESNPESDSKELNYQLYGTYDQEDF